MNRLAQQAILSGLATRLGSRGSWVGETHLQKAAYLLSQLRGVDFDFDFILYKHGPFSFELRDELALMTPRAYLKALRLVLATVRKACDRQGQGHREEIREDHAALRRVAGLDSRHARLPWRHGSRASCDGDVDDSRGSRGICPLSGRSLPLFSRTSRWRTLPSLSKRSTDCFATERLTRRNRF